jgi:hypothetical protein
MRTNQFFPQGAFVMTMRHAASLLGLLSQLLYLVAMPARGQSTNATINGQVTDAQGRAVPGTEVDALT